MKRLGIFALCLFTSFSFINKATSDVYTELDLSYLTVETLPPPGMVADAAINALPRSLSEMQEYERRLRASALVPRLELQYRQTETGERRFDHVERVTTRSVSSYNLTEADEMRISAQPNDSFIQERSTERFANQRFTERQPITVLALDDEEVTRDMYQIQVNWRLQDIIYHPAELRVPDVNRMISHHRNQKVEKIVPLYRAFINSVRQMENNPTSRQARETVGDRLLVLDMLTDDFISSYAIRRFGELRTMAD